MHRFLCLEPFASVEPFASIKKFCSPFHLSTSGTRLNLHFAWVLVILNADVVLVDFSFSLSSRCHKPWLDDMGFDCQWAVVGYGEPNFLQTLFVGVSVIVSKFFFMVLYRNILLYFEECYPTSAFICQVLNWKCDRNSHITCTSFFFHNKFLFPFIVLETCEWLSKIAEIPWMLVWAPHVCDNQFAALVWSNNLLKKKIEIFTNAR
jgi:hypothetical protein